MPGESASLERTSQFTALPADWVSPLTGLGQIMFQNSPLTGVFFLTGIAVVSPLMAAGAAVGAAIGTLTAYLLRYDRAEIRDGLYGFNAALVGIAMLANYEFQVLTVVIASVACAISTPLAREMRRQASVPTYTTPFIVTTWLGLLVAHRLNVPAVVHSQAAIPDKLDLTTAIIAGISEVMFQANVLTGAMFVVGIFLCSWKGAVWAIIGSMVGLLIAMSHNDPVENLSLGIYGYNAALAAMAMALYRRSVMLPIVAAIISVPITENFPLIGLPTLTAPFVLACWAVIAMYQIDFLLNRPQQAGTG